MAIANEISKARIRIKRATYPRFVLGSNENGRELSIEAKELLDARDTDRSIPFKQVKMKWGYRRLNEYDALISACEQSKYYIARHHWDRWYHLDNGKKFTLSQDICRELRNGAKSITIRFKKAGSNGTPGSTEETSKASIMLGSCNFKWENGRKSPSKKALKMTCKGVTSESGKRAKEEDIFLTLEDGDYKLEYNPTKSSPI